MDSTPQNIMIVGGYGAVGTPLTAALASWFPGRVLAAGRRPRPDGPGRPVRVDIADPAAFAGTLAAERVGTVVLCVEPPDATIARRCLERGVNLVDIGASHHLLAQVERLDGLAVAAGAAAVLSVGLAPGLTNLLARRAVDDLGEADRVDITLFFGAGERYGADALRWTLDGLTRPAATRPLRVDVPGRGRRTAHPMPFSDQHTLPRTLGVPEVTTRLSLQPAPLAAALFGLRRLGVFRALSGPRARRAVLALLGRIHVGGEGYAVRVDAHRGARSAGYAVTGRTQSRGTALVTAHTTRRVVAGAVPAGVHHTDQLPDSAGLLEDIVAAGVTLWTPEDLARAAGTAARV